MPEVTRALTSYQGEGAREGAGPVLRSSPGQGACEGAGATFEGGELAQGVH